jgi:hypothetical protein
MYIAHQLRAETSPRVYCTWKDPYENQRKIIWDGQEKPLISRRRDVLSKQLCMYALCGAPLYTQKALLLRDGASLHSMKARQNSTRFPENL